MLQSIMKERLYHQQPIISFEFFPPKTEKGDANLRDAMQALVPLKPDFVSVTYGAGGGTRDRTRELVLRMKQEYGLQAMVHLTCIGHTREELVTLIKEYGEAGIEDILALRGDRPRSWPADKPLHSDLGHACDLVRLVHETGAFSVGVAGFPEIHTESDSLDADLAFLKKKVEAGAHFVITQLFFDNQDYYRYVRAARAAGITVPIIPGIMPVTSYGQLQKFREMCGCRIPQAMEEQLSADNLSEADVESVGLAYCVAQCADLLRSGAPGLHLYTLNKSRAGHRVLATLHALELLQPKVPLTAPASDPTAMADAMPA